MTTSTGGSVSRQNSYTVRDAQYVTSSTSPTIPNHIVSLEAAVATKPRRLSLKLALDAAAADRRHFENRIRGIGNEPRVDDVLLSIQNCGFQPGQQIFTSLNSTMGNADNRYMKEWSPTLSASGAYKTTVCPGSFHDSTIYELHVEIR